MRSYPPLTVAFIAICVAVALMSGLGRSIEILEPLLISSSDSNGLAEIASGEIWRLVTPIFIHFGVLHLVFNMLWLWDLGSVLERTKGRLFLANFVLVDGIVSNLAQYLFTGSPFFGGMSGVVYGLLGYAWMQGQFNPRFGFVLHKHIVIMMLVWFVICWLGLVGPVANWAHTVGLVVGIVWGFIAARITVLKIRGKL